MELTTIPSLGCSDISLPDCLPNLYFWKHSKNNQLVPLGNRFIHIGKQLLEKVKTIKKFTVQSACTWRWLFKWKRVSPFTPIVRMMVFGVASAKKNCFLRHTIYFYEVENLKNHRWQHFLQTYETKTAQQFKYYNMWFNEFLWKRSHISDN